MITGRRRCAARAVCVPRSYPRKQSQLPAAAATRRFARHHLPNSLPPRSVVAWDACTRGILPIFPRVSVFTHHARPPSPQCSSRAARPSSPHTPARFSLLASFVPYLYSTSTQPLSHAPHTSFLFVYARPGPSACHTVQPLSIVPFSRSFVRLAASLFVPSAFPEPSSLFAVPTFCIFPAVLRLPARPFCLHTHIIIHHIPPLTALSSVSRARPLVLHSVPSSSQ